MRKYKNLDIIGQHRILQSIQKYGWENHQVETIYSGPLTQEGLNQLEIHYIRIFNSFKGGLNMTEGGGGCRGRSLSQKHLAVLKQPKSEEHKLKMKQAATGRVMSKELIEKRSAARSKPVEQWTLDGVFLREWTNPLDAAEGIGQPRHNGSSIRACCLGKPSYHTAFGYIWRWKS